VKNLPKQILKNVSQNNMFTLVDIGSMGGIEKEWKQVGDAIKVIGFEPDKREFNKLNNSKNHLYLNCVLFSESVDQNFYVSRQSGKSSIYRPNTEVLKVFPDIERFDIVEEVSFGAEKVKNLDDVLRDNEILDADFLKLDTQGSELSILKGSQKCLNESILGLKIEVEFLEIYKNQPLFADVDIFMRSKGFELIDLRRFFWKRKEYASFRGKGQIAFADALYFKNIDKFIVSIESREELYKRAKIIKFVTVCVIYGIHDYAFSILNKSLENKLIDEELYREIVDLIRKHDKKQWNISFKGSGKLLVKLDKILRKSYLGWADSDYTLGNK